MIVWRMISLPFGGNVFFFFLNLLDVVFTYRYTIFHIEIVVDSTPRQRFSFFEQRQTFKQLVFVLISTELLDRLQQGCKDTLLRGACTYDISPDTVDRGIEIVESDMHAVESVGTDNLLKQIHGVVIHDGYVVGIPAYRATYVEHQFGDEKQQGTHFVCHALCRNKMAGVKGANHLVACTVTCVEVVRTYG